MARRNSTLPTIARALAMPPTINAVCAPNTSGASAATTVSADRKAKMSSSFSRMGATSVNQVIDSILLVMKASRPFRRQRPA